MEEAGPEVKRCLVGDFRGKEGTKKHRLHQADQIILMQGPRATCSHLGLCRPLVPSVHSQFPQAPRTYVIPASARFLGRSSALRHGGREHGMV